MKNLVKLFKPKSLKLNSKAFSSTLKSGKIYPSSDEAVKDIKSNSSILLGGFGICGIPSNLIRALAKRKEVRDLELISNNGGLESEGNGILISNGQVKRLTGSYVGENKTLEKLYLTGKIEINLTPQGTLAEKIRAGGAGIPAFYTPTGYATYVQEGGIEIKLDSNGKPLIVSKPKPTAIFNGRNYVMEESITADYSFVRALKADTEGNLIFRKTARNFNQDIATAGKITIAEVEEIVEAGKLDPDSIHCPGIYVNRIVKAENPEKKIERYRKQGEKEKDDGKGKIARRAAEELRDGMYVNLGIGTPNLVTDYLDKNTKVVIHTENGMLGVGPYPYGEEDPDLVSAIKEPVSETKGCSYFKSSDSFGMVRGRHVDVTILGAFQVSGTGDLANWIVPGKIIKGMGGAMDLVGSGNRVIVTMEHVTVNKVNKEKTMKIMEKCSYPLTGKGVVDTLITDMAVFKFDANYGMILTDLFKGVNLEEVKKLTGCKFRVADKLKVLDY